MHYLNLYRKIKNSPQMQMSLLKQLYEDIENNGSKIILPEGS